VWWNTEIAAPRQVGARSDNGTGVAMTAVVVSNWKREGWPNVLLVYNGNAEKEVQDTSCRGSGSVPQTNKSPPRLGDIGGS